MCQINSCCLLERSNPTQMFVLTMVWNRPHNLDTDVRRLRLRFLPKRTFGQVALCAQVPYDSINLRDCTANGE